MKAFSLIFLTVLLLTPRDAHAYLDPGTGSLILQAVIGGILVVTSTFTLFWKSIRSFFGRIFSRSQG